MLRAGVLRRGGSAPRAAGHRWDDAPHGVDLRRFGTKRAPPAHARGRCLTVPSSLPARPNSTHFRCAPRDLIYGRIIILPVVDHVFNNVQRYSYILARSAAAGTQRVRSVYAYGASDPVAPPSASARVGDALGDRTDGGGGLGGAPDAAGRCGSGRGGGRQRRRQGRGHGRPDEHGAQAGDAGGVGHRLGRRTSGGADRRRPPVRTVFLFLSTCSRPAMARAKRGWP